MGAKLEMMDCLLKNLGDFWKEFCGDVKGVCYRAWIIDERWLWAKNIRGITWFMCSERNNKQQNCILFLLQIAGKRPIK